MSKKAKAETQTPLLVVNPSEYSFIEFAERISDYVTGKHSSADWFVTLRELDAKIHTANLKDKINFSDDRLVLCAFKIMRDTNVFGSDLNATVKEWFVVQRYLDVFTPPETVRIGQLRTFVNSYIGKNFSGAEIDEVQVAEMDALAEILSNERYDFLPSFVTNAFGGDAANFTLSEAEKTQWEELKQVAEMMIPDTKGAEKKEWKELLATCEMMLN